ncbi:MAG TPA: hypothetical protein PKH07_20895, partial [bacterium]|nr:hypothetical protein [bacterium]
KDISLVDKGWQESGVLRGFSPMGGLPRMPARAVLRGSCFAVQIDDQSKKEEVRKVLFDAWRKGLGERTVEGLGRFHIVIPGDSTSQTSKTVTDGGTDKKNQTESVPETIADLKEQVLQELDGLFEKELKGLVKNGPSKSQWASFAALLLSTKDDDSVNEAIEVLNKRKDKKSGKKWAEKVAGKELPMWMKGKFAEWNRHCQLGRHFLLMLARRAVQIQKNDSTQDRTEGKNG